MILRGCQSLMNYKYTELNHSSIIVIMTTIAEEVLTELSSTTEH